MIHYEAGAFLHAGHRTSQCTCRSSVRLSRLQGKRRCKLTEQPLILSSTDMLDGFKPLPAKRVQTKGRPSCVSYSGLQ